MAVLPILRFPDQRLHTVAKPVDAFDDSLRRLVSDMAETMYEAPGIGLAATQVNVHEQVIVIDVSEDKSKLLTTNIWLTDISTFAEMNSAWDAWVSPGNTPARATVEVFQPQAATLARSVTPAA